MTPKESHTFCPFSGGRCNSYCGLWSDNVDGCAMTVIANKLEDLTQDLYWIRRAVEDEH